MTLLENGQPRGRSSQPADGRIDFDRANTAAIEAEIERIQALNADDLRQLSASRSTYVAFR